LTQGATNARHQSRLNGCQGGLSQFERAQVQPDVSRAGHGNACSELSTLKSILRQAKPLPLKMFLNEHVVDSTL
jgi:hypothetical protein